MKTIRCQLFALFWLSFLSSLFAQNKLVGLSQKGEYQGAYSEGMIWGVNFDGTGFTVLKNWETPASPSALIQGKDENYYGATTAGGQNGNGYIYKMKPDGSDFLPVFQTPPNVKILSLLEGSNGRLFGGAIKTDVYSQMIFSIEPDGTGYSILVDDPDISAKFFSEGPDGQLYWFEHFNLWRMNYDGSGKTDLGALFAPNFELSFSEAFLKQLPNGNLWGWINYAYPLGGFDEGYGQQIFILNADGTLATIKSLPAYLHYSNMVVGHDNFIYSKNKKFDIPSLTESLLPNIEGCFYTLQLGGSDGWLYGKTFEFTSETLADLTAYNPAKDTCRSVATAEQVGYMAEFCFEVAMTIAVEQPVQHEMFSISPNPAYSTLNVVSRTTSDSREWQLHSVTGQLMSFETEVNETWEISLEDLPQGVYLLTIREKGQAAFNKMFIKLP